MKRTFFIFLTLVSFLGLMFGTALAQEETEATTPDYASARNQISFSLGVYSPSEDMDDEFDVHWEDGGDLTATYTRLFGRYFGLEAGLHAYGSTFDDGALEGTFSSSGTEILFLYVPYHKRIMAYVGAGVGFYSNHLEVEYANVKLIDDDGSASGAVLKGGVRANLTRKFFLGGFIKAFENNQEFEYENGHKETINMGGTTVNLEFGLTF